MTNFLFIKQEQSLTKKTYILIAKIVLLLSIFVYANAEAFLGFGEKKQEVSFSAIILSYGAISKQTPPNVSTPPEIFIRQIEELEAKGFTVWKLSQIMKAIRKRAKLPPKLAAITFDAGYKSVIETAFPILEAKKIPFTVFIAKDFADYKSYLKNPNYMDMQDLKVLWDSKLVEFGNNSLGLQSLAKKQESQSHKEWQEAVIKNIDENAKWIETNFAKTQLFAYPQGETNADLEKILKRKQLYGFTKTDGAASLYSPLVKIPRFDLTGFGKDMYNFKNKLFAVPFPVKTINYPHDDVLQTQAKPMLQLDIYQGEYRIERLKCFDEKGFDLPFSKEFIKLKPKENSVYRIKIRAEKDLHRNSSYNCVMPHKTQTRYFWFSKKFI